MQGATVARKMRILALPLTAKTATRDALTYHHFITRAPSEEAQNSLLGKAKAKAAGTWAGFGKADGGWKLKVFTYGEKLIDRVDYEELALSGLDPALGPRVTKFGKPSVDVEKNAGDSALNVNPNTDTSPIALIHPKFYSSTSPVNNIQKLLEARSPKHKRGFLTWAIIAPLTAPFAILPVIPNLPFFFCVWRAWTHWRAYRASDYLLSLLNRNAIASEENDALDAIYKRYSPTHTTPSSSSVESAPSTSETKALLEPTRGEPLLLTKEAVPPILELFQLPEDAAADMYRAIEQARQRASTKE